MLDFMLAFAGGVMIAASFWSLLAPAIALAEEAGGAAWLPAAVGFMAGGVFIRLIDMVLPHLHLGFPIEEAEGIKTSQHSGGPGGRCGLWGTGDRIAARHICSGGGFGVGDWDSKFSRGDGGVGAA